MNSAEIRQKFLDFFQARGHEICPSSPLVPAGDPTLLFTNAGMVQFKGVFLGSEALLFKRAVTAQKCIRAGGKHNDLEEVGRTARHHTFFEMLGNFSFGDYFKPEAVAYAWEFLTEALGLNPDRLFVTVHHTDNEAARLWTDVAGVAPERIHCLGDKDNFWQMADTGPCGPCSEIHYDLRPAKERGIAPGTREFEQRGEAGEFLELWNLVFMQFDRDPSGALHILPAPSIDTGAGLERIATVLQGVSTNYETDLFLPLLARVAGITGRPYRADTGEGVSYRVLADHARAVAFLLADGVFPANEGRGYVLRRILRRGVRHGWLLGQREPALVQVVESVVDGMADAYPELEVQRESILAATRREEERFLATIDGGVERLRRVAPRLRSEGSHRPVVPGAEVFRLYDTYGFPADLTRIMADERGYDVDIEGFEKALAVQRERSRADRRSKDGGPDVALTLTDTGSLPFTVVDDLETGQTFVGYDSLTASTRVLAFRDLGGGLVKLILEAHPFYAEGGGQVSDRGSVWTPEWSMEVEGVTRSGELLGVHGRPTGDFPGASVKGSEVTARVAADVRHDTERNHTATHLLHEALRSVLGSHVRQRGSLVAPDRLRFDFAHTAPLADAELEAVEARVNESIRACHPVRIRVQPYEVAVKAGAMALFGEKYDSEVRVVEIPGVSTELCGGTHVRYTGEVGVFKVTSETGVAAGVRRLEAVTGRAAYLYLNSYKDRIQALAAFMKTAPANLEKRVRQLMAENAELEEWVEGLRHQGSGGEVVAEDGFTVDGRPAIYRGVRLKVRSPGDARGWGDAFRESSKIGVAVVGAEMPGEKYALLVFATDRAIAAGVKADVLIKEVAAVVGGRGGGRPHMAQAGVAEPERINDAIRAGADFMKRLISESSQRTSAQ